MWITGVGNWPRRSSAEPMIDAGWPALSWTGSHSIHSHPTVIHSFEAVIHNPAGGAMRIDVHAHLFPDAYMDCLARLGHPDARAAVLRAPGGQLTLEERFALLDRCGVDMQVLSPAAAAP